MNLVRSNIMENKQRIYKFFPFAFSKLCSLLKYLNKMYEQGYKIVDINWGCILVFEKTTNKSGYSYYILTEHFSRGGRTKWNDIKFLEERIIDFYDGNGEQIKKFDAFVGVYYYIYLSKNISNSEYQSLCDFRKRYIHRVNVRRFIIYFFINHIYCTIF